MVCLRSSLGSACALLFEFSMATQKKREHQYGDTGNEDIIRCDGCLGDLRVGPQHDLPCGSIRHDRICAVADEIGQRDHLDTDIIVCMLYLEQCICEDKLQKYQIQLTRMLGKDRPIRSDRMNGLCARANTPTSRRSQKVY